MLDDWPLTGRDDERRVLGELLIPERPRSVVISGPSGAGRTRLAREALAMAVDAGRPTRWAAGTAAAAAIPLGAMAHLVPPPGPGVAPDADAFTLLQRAMSTLTAHPDLVVAVDDAHLLDELSLTLLHQLVTGGEIALVVTARTGGPGPDRLAPLWKDGAATRLELAPLAREHADRLVAAALGGHVDTRTGERLWRLSRGNPLFLYELVSGGWQSGTLDERSGVWRWDGEMVPPPRLVDIVLAQLDGLDGEEHAALEVLAVGEALGLERLVALSGREAVESLERRGLLGVDAHGQARPAHPLHAEVVRSRMPGTTTSRILRELAFGSARRPSHDELLRASRLACEPGGPELDVELLTEAAGRANAMLDHALAERLARTAVERGAGISAHLALVEAVRWQDRPSEVEELCGAAVPLATADGDRSRLTVLRALNLADGLDRPAEAAQVLDGIAPTDAAARAALAAARALLAFLGGAPLRAVELGTPILRAAQEAEPVRGCGPPLAAAAVTAGLAVTGRAAESIRAAGRGARMLQRVPDEGVATFVRVALARAELLALRLAGRFVELESRAAELHQQSMTAPDWAGDAIAAFHVGCAALATGRLRRAARWLTEARAGLRRRDPAGLLPMCTAELARVRALLGDGAGAAELLATPEAAEPAGADRAPVQLARAWHRAVAVGVSQAVDGLLPAADRAAGRGEWAVEAELRHAVVQFGRPGEVAERLRELAGRTGNELVALFADHAEAAVAGSGTGLDGVAAAFEERGGQLLAADAAAAAADAHQRAGDRRRSSGSATVAVRLAGACDGPRTPALARLTPPRLTAREQEVTNLVAGGLSNAAIARRLVLSVRTVEAHLAHAYAKLGINSRAALRDVLGDPAASSRS
jgi:DNA-binding NarL/FixJ family response regulator